MEDNLKSSKFNDLKRLLVKQRLYFLWILIILASLFTCIWPIQFLTISTICVRLQAYWNGGLSSHLFFILCYATFVVIPFLVFMKSMRESRVVLIILSAIFACLFVPVFFMNSPDPGNRLPLCRIMFSLSAATLIGVVIYTEKSRQKFRTPESVNVEAINKATMGEWLKNNKPILSLKEDYLLRYPFALELAKTIHATKKNDKVLTLIGEEGSGKTSLLNLINETIGDKNRMICCVISKNDLKPTENQTSCSLLLAKLRERIETLLDKIKNDKTDDYDKTSSISKESWKKHLNTLSRICSGTSEKSFGEIESSLCEHQCRILYVFDEVDSKTLKELLQKMHRFTRFRFLVTTSGRMPIDTFPAELSPDVRFLRSQEGNNFWIEFIRVALNACCSCSSDCQTKESTCISKTKSWENMVDYVEFPHQVKAILEETKKEFERFHDRLNREDILYYVIYDKADIKNKNQMFQADYEAIKKIRDENTTNA